jgi:hypothetical protein
LAIRRDINRDHSGQHCDAGSIGGAVVTFRVGQRICCVDDAPKSNGHPAVFPGSYFLPNWPKRRNVYTVRFSDPELGVHLVEVVNPVRPFLQGECEGHFDPDRFVPLIERTTDISFAHEILRKVGGKVRA